VQEELERATEGRIRIIIAHRLSTVRHTDAISVFKDGEIVESGKHGERMRGAQGGYQELVYLLQVEGKIAAHSGPDSRVRPALQTWHRISQMIEFRSRKRIQSILMHESFPRRK
jgi:ABC-type dipeptide/oligopeptide/nickel transport system ATPase component